MDLNWLGFVWKPAQLQSINPFLVMFLIPIFAYIIYPMINKVFKLTALRKIGLGLFLTAFSFLIPVWIETQIAAGARPSVGWQFVAYIFLTSAEIMVSITALEFSYTQAPKKMKSFIQAIFLMSISLGNAFSAAVNAFIENEDGTSKLSDVGYYLFFILIMLVTAVIFIPVAARYKEKDYIQDEGEEKA